jgi:hypothetical protein
MILHKRRQPQQQTDLSSVTNAAKLSHYYINSSKSYSSLIHWDQD